MTSAARAARCVDAVARGDYDARQLLQRREIAGGVKEKEGAAMRKLLTMGLVVGIVAGLATLTVHRAAADSEEAALRTLVPKIIGSWESLDISKIEPQYAADTDFAYFDLVPMKYSNWAEYRVGVQKALFDPNKSIKLHLNDDLGVHRRGSLAWATVTFGADIVSKQGSASHLDGRWTMVLEKRAHGWIVVHEHVSAPLGGS
jgi:ketosteroid isomerase-like protein